MGTSSKTVVVIPVSKVEQRPYNPLNGHAFTCSCTHCVVFWDGEYGTAVYEGWRKYDRASRKGE